MLHVIVRWDITGEYETIIVSEITFYTTKEGDHISFSMPRHAIEGVKGGLPWESSIPGTYIVYIFILSIMLLAYCTCGIYKNVHNRPD